MYSKGQRIMAWAGIACLLFLYIVSFILGVSGSKQAFPMFIASLLATFFIPTMIYLFQLFLKNARGRQMMNEEPIESDEENSSDN